MEIKIPCRDNRRHQHNKNEILVESNQHLKRISDGEIDIHAYTEARAYCQLF